jgi:RNA polymerase sigma factor (sigma-70 family)
VSTPDVFSNADETLRSVYAYVAYRIGPGPDAEDVVSETVERAIRYRDSYKPSAGTPTAWMIGIAKRCLADAHGNGAYRVDLDVDQLLGTQDDFTNGACERADLYAAIGHLEERDRELLALRYGADLSARQIGRVLEMRTNAVEVALHRTLGRLRQELEA